MEQSREFKLPKPDRALVGEVPSWDLSLALPDNPLESSFQIDQLAELAANVTESCYERKIPSEAIVREIIALGAHQLMSNDVHVLRGAIDKVIVEGGQLELLPALFINVREHCHHASQLSLQDLLVTFNTERRFFCGSEGEIDGGGSAKFQSLVAIALNQPQLRNVAHGALISAIGEILGSVSVRQQQRVFLALSPMLNRDTELQDIELLRDLLCREKELGQRDRLNALGTFSASMSHLKADNPQLWQRCREFVSCSLAAGFESPRILFGCFIKLIESKINPIIIEAFLIAIPRLTQERSGQNTAELVSAALQAWITTPPNEQACRSFIEALKQDGAAHAGQLFARLLASCYERSESQQVSWSLLGDLTGVLVESQTNAYRHEIHRRLADLHRGYANSLRFDLKRLPYETVSPLARFGLELGALQLVHASSNEGFPGSGIVLSNLATEKIFVMDPNSPTDPFISYKKAWPSLASKIPDLTKLKLVLCRGVMIIHGPAEHTIAIGRGSAQHYSLMIFNDHHHNTSLIKALLVDSAWLLNRLSPCLKDWQSSWSPAKINSSVHDINGMGLLPEEILAQNRSDKIIAVDVGSPLTMASSIGQEIAGYLMETLNLFDLFRLAHAVVHKGFAGEYGLGCDYSLRQDDSEQGEIYHSSILMQAPAPAENEGDLVANEASLGPLLDALKWHLYLKSEGGPVSEHDPMLVTAKTLSYSDSPDGDFVLDLRSLECRIHDLPFALFDRSYPVLTLDVELIWLNELLPRFMNSFQDLRIVPRGQLKRRVLEIDTD